MVSLDRITKRMFNRFPREMGLPWKVPVRNWKEVMRIVNENNGYRDIFISLYDTKDFIIDKMMFDLDILDLELAGKFYRFLTEELNLPTIPFFSGKKGFHFYVVFKPYKFDNLDHAKACLRRISYTIIDEGGFYEKKGDYKVSILDSKIFGDLRKSARFPNTLRPPENVTYATYLPSDFYNMTWEEFFQWVKTTHYDMNYHLNPKIRVVDFETTDAIYDYVLGYQQNYSKAYVIKQTLRDKSLEDRDRENLIKYLSYLIRPCILEQLISDDPSHDIRTAATIDLMNLEFSIVDVVEIYKKLGWVDFDENYTRKQVEEIYKNGLLPYSCKKLKLLGYCDLPLDEFCDFWIK